jgi:lipopolysaccharide/colanic/teichoic acid biosynthesis glycosyltransferase
MKLTVIFENNCKRREGGTGKQGKFVSSSQNDHFLKFAFGSEPLRSVILRAQSRSFKCKDEDAVVALPYAWDADGKQGDSHILRYKENIPLSSLNLRSSQQNQWHMISNSRFITYTNLDWLHKTLNKIDAAVIAVSVKKDLCSNAEKLIANSKGKLSGFRRFYKDTAQLGPLTNDWPNYVFIRPVVFQKYFIAGVLPLSFTEFVQTLTSEQIKVRALTVAGVAFDLDTEGGLLEFLARYLQPDLKSDNGFIESSSHEDDIMVANSARLFGKILLGQNVHIDEEALVIGPTIICDNVKLLKGAVVKKSIIGPNVSISCNDIVKNHVLINSQKSCKQRTWKAVSKVNRQEPCAGTFRKQPKFSYADCFKRIADIVGATIIIVLFAPVIPLIAFAIKLNSPGPVFFKTRRQGFGGKEFNCIKFRTMVAGADEMQDKLRVVNQMDGPQFKIDNDPRVNTVGRFLRDTYIDEIPQFFNVFIGQMSIVGPRPSPETENTLCPSWRDARLSVRPGITGLWQVSRTRQPMKDFQEWIYYDKEYVRKLSLKLDLWICVKTVKKMAKNFISQF